MAHFYLAVNHLLTGDFEEALTEAGRASLDKAPDRVSRAYAALFLAFALLEHGDHDQALNGLAPG